jgi:hypothetical protein
MVNYICLRCGFSNKSKTHFMNHLNRKFPCKPKLNDIPLKDVKTIFLSKKNASIGDNMTNVAQNCTVVHTKLKKLHQKALDCTVGIETDSDFTCEFCKKSFTRNSSKLRHLKTCKVKKAQNESKEKEYNDLKNLVKLMNEKLEQTTMQFKSLKKEIKRKNNQIVELQKKAGITIGTQNNNIQNNIKNDIKILAFNKTDMSHLNDKDFLSFLDHANFCIPHMIKKLHFDPEKPENHNIYISNIKNNYVMLYDGNKWTLQDQKNVIDNLLQDNTYILEEKMEDWIKRGQKYPKIMEKFNRYLEKKENDNILDQIKEEVKLILFNNRQLVLQDE